MRITILAAVLAWVQVPSVAPAANGLEIIWVDVEGGAATLIVTPAGESLLMDCGWPLARDAERIKQAAERARVKKIDHLLTSHWHSDHFGGIEELVKRIPVKKFYDHGFPEANAPDIDPKLKESYLRITGGKSAVLKPGDTIPLTGVTVKILASHGSVIGEEPGGPQTRWCQANPEHPARPDDVSDNFRSLAFLLSVGEFDFFNSGDLSWNVEHKLVCPANLVGTVDVYQVSHHGSDANPAVFGAVQPTVAVVNNGARKGGDARTFKSLRETPGLKDIFQLHRSLASVPADNAPPKFVANDEETCPGAWIKLTVDASGKSYAVEVPSKGTKLKYACK